MRYLSIRLDALAPLAIRSDHAPGGANVAEYIAGSALIGCLAAVHRLLRPTEKAEFEQLFLSDQVLYSNLYPAVFADEGWPDEGLNDHNDLPVYPVPKTAQSCKRHPGFLFPRVPKNDGHGVRDGLLDWALFKLGDSSGLKGQSLPYLKALQEGRKCDRCQSSMDRFSGYYRCDDLDPYKVLVAHPTKRLQTHTGVNRDTRTVQERILYNREIFNEGTRFWGTVKLPEDEALCKSFQAFLDDVGPDGLVHIGTGRSRGMGKIAICAEERTDVTHSFEHFTDRMTAFSTLLRKQIGEVGLDQRQSYFFTLTLHSPLILCDDLFRYRSTIDAAILTELLGPEVELPGLKLIYQVADMKRITGWQVLWGTPRTNEYAIETGSVFLFKCAKPLSTEAQKALFKLEEHGIGKRRREGFGQICISDPFHLEVERR